MQFKKISVLPPEKGLEFLGAKKCFKLITTGISRGFEGTLPSGRYGYFLELDNNKNTLMLHKA